MNKSFFSAILFVFLVGVSSFIQASVASFAGIRPNLALILLIFFALRGEFAPTFAATSLALFVIKPGPVVDFPSTVFALFVLALALVRRFMPWRESVANPLFIFAGTVFMYLSAQPSLLFSKLFLEEIAANLVLGVAFFALFSWAWQNDG